MRVFGEEGEEQEAKDELITEPSSIFNRLALFFIAIAHAWLLGGISSSATPNPWCGRQ